MGFSLQCRIEYTVRLGDVSTCGATERRQKHKNKVGNK
jgi:hypothetical protein